MAKTANTLDTHDTVTRTVLVVEDNEINREMLKAILEEQYRVLEAGDGVEGLETLRAHARELSLVLLDVEMPRMNGYEFLEQYRDDPILSTVPVIVTTAGDSTDNEEKCLMLGASDFVTKPYHPGVILRRAEAIIRLRESTATLRAVEFDPLTGLYNNRAFLWYAEKRLQNGTDAPYDMLLLNVEDFSYVNERYGEQNGDKLLRHIGQRLAPLSARGMLCGRYSADRFVVLRPRSLGSVYESLEAFDVALHENAPVESFVMKYAVYKGVDTSAAVGVLCERLVTAVAKIRHQYEQKVVYYDDSMAEREMRLRRIASCMEQALEERQFAVYYQPKIDPHTNRIAGAEALVRWIHPEYGFMSPGDFIPLFEENGFIVKLDAYVFRRVCEDLRGWQDQGLPAVPVSVNVSRRDLLSPYCRTQIRAATEENGVDRKLLHIEITESAFADRELVLDYVQDLRKEGYLVELDDFGSGYSSLGMIRDIPMDIIKLDISFARQIEKQKEVVRMIITLAHALGLKTVAEGVETEGQLAILKEYGCDYIQGYYYSKPLPKPDFEQYLKIKGE